MTQRVPTYSPLPGPAHPTSVSEAVAVKFSPEAVPEALTQCEQETRRFKTPLVRGDNTDKDGDKQMWYFHGPAPSLFKVDNNFIPQVSAWSESVSME